ncbi:MAG: nonstructural protein [Microvirus sp.]|nr:MAG: nonstructural protein [Microvirus sp.]
MTLKIFAIYDTKACAYGIPFFMSTEGQARRAFQDLANDNTSNISKHPEDYSLHYLGDFDDTHAEITPTRPQLMLHAQATTNNVTNITKVS